MIVRKRCTRCGEVKELGEFYKLGRGGHSSGCKICLRAKSRAYWRATRGTRNITCQGSLFTKKMIDGFDDGYEALAVNILRVAKQDKDWIWMMGIDATGLADLAGFDRGAYYDKVCEWSDEGER